MKEQKQLVVRVHPNLIRKLKVLAALRNVSMAELVRGVLSDWIRISRQDKEVAQALEAAGLEDE